MELFNYYSLDECSDARFIIERLKELEFDGKIEYSLDKSNDVFKIEVIDLEDNDIEILLDLFDEYDVFPYFDIDEDDDEDSYDDDYDDDY